MSHRKRVIIESPYAGDVLRNIAYAIECARDCIERGEAPIASHLIYTFILDDAKKEEREAGIEVGFAWREPAELSAVYKDFGISYGMEYGIADANGKGHLVEHRILFKDEAERENFERRIPQLIAIALIKFLKLRPRENPMPFLAILNELLELRD